MLYKNKVAAFGSIDAIPQSPDGDSSLYQREPILF